MLLHELACADLVDRSWMRFAFPERLSREVPAREAGTADPAAVVGSAARWVLLSEIPPQEHASAFLGLA
jgi:hypothetical protein